MRILFQWLALRGASVALDLQERIVAVGANQEMEDCVHPLQRLTAALERCDGVVEVRWV